VRELYADKPGAEFGPLCVKAARQKWINDGRSRTECNRRVAMIKRIFKWAVSEELALPEVYQSVATVTGLQKGRTAAREKDPVGPVEDAVVDATLPFLGRHVRGLVEFQRLRLPAKGDLDADPVARYLARPEGRLPGHPPEDPTGGDPGRYNHRRGAPVSRILVVEDEGKVRRGLEVELRAAGYDVAAASTGDDGLRLALAEVFDCLVLDWMLPGRDGMEILSSLRDTGRTTPVLLLTARDAVEDRVLGLESGADDYLVKPFALAELLARVKALLRRGQPDRETVLRAAGLEIDLVRRRVTRDGAEIALTQREFEVLEYLARHKGRTVTREMLGRDVWKDPNYALTNVVEVYVNLLRKKLDTADGPSVIATVRGAGYRLKD
jgi:DNA-binding response OmpR family regulator